MWTGTSRRQHSRSGLCYPSDLRDAEWALVEPMLPPLKPGGRLQTCEARKAKGRKPPLLITDRLGLMRPVTL